MPRVRIKVNNSQNSKISEREFEESGKGKAVDKKQTVRYKDASAKKAYIEKSEITITAIDIPILLLVYISISMSSALEV